MSAFFLLIFLSSWLNISPLMFAMPVIWFFAFFDTHNLRSMPDAEFYATKDSYIFIPEFTKEKSRIFQSKYRNIMALVLIIIGFSILWNNTYYILDLYLPGPVSNAISNFGRYFPQLAIGLAIIALGLYLIKGKKKDLDDEAKESQNEDKGGLQL